MNKPQRAACAFLVVAALAACSGSPQTGQGLIEPGTAQTNGLGHAGTHPTPPPTHPPTAPPTHPPTPPPTQPPTAPPTSSPLSVIKHVVLMIQENRSVDNLFQAYPGANTASSGQISTGQTVPLTPIPIHVSFDVAHGLPDFLAACDGGPQGNPCKNDAFDLERLKGQSESQYPAYSYVPQSDTTLYWQLAQQYVLADNSFQSHLDASFVAHQYLIAAQAQHAVDLPNGVWGCPANVATINSDRTIGPLEKACFDEPTVASELDDKQLSWKMYAPMPHDAGFNWVAFHAIDAVFHGPEWQTNISKPNTNILSDISGGTLPAMSWVIPSFQVSDHEGASNQGGENWVTTVVNAVGASPYWSSTAIIVVWDDWGGFYDHVPPQYVDYDGLGFRTPFLVISPYGKQNYISHVQYEFGSIVQFVEDVFGLGRLSASDSRAASIVPDCFDFAQHRRRFRRIRTTMSHAEIIRQAQSVDSEAIQAYGD